MEVPAQLVLLSLPSLVYFAFWRLKGRLRREVLRRLGLWESRGVYYLYGLLIFLSLSALYLVANALIPPDYLDRPEITASYYADMVPGLSTALLALVREAFYVALGEEIFFRGLLGGWLMRRFGFHAGNALQTLIFLLPHLPLLVILGPGSWPLLLFPLFAGWLLGWLRYRSGSILPGWLCHTLANTVSAVSAMSG